MAKASVSASAATAQQPLILRAHRLMEAFAKSDDERDFYLDRSEGFILYADLDKSQEELDLLEKELRSHTERYCFIPKLTFYETKKFMEGFVNEKVYDIDTKEKLLDIIQAKEARTNFLEFLSDHHAEQEKWQLYYQERSRIRIIEWLRQNHFDFVFEEDLEFPRDMLEALKENVFVAKVNKEVAAGRKLLSSKAASYYSSEALHPRPKRGRPPKQVAKQEVEPQKVSLDIYMTVPEPTRPFLFIPDISSLSAVTFSSEFADPSVKVGKRGSAQSELAASEEEIKKKLAELRTLSARWVQTESPVHDGKKIASRKPVETQLDEEIEASTKKNRVVASPVSMNKNLALPKNKVLDLSKNKVLNKSTTPKKKSRATGQTGDAAPNKWKRIIPATTKKKVANKKAKKTK